MNGTIRIKKLKYKRLILWLMIGIITCSISWFAWTSYHVLQNEAHYTLSSKHFKQIRNYTIYLPQSYEETDKQYPVLYILDGERLRNNRIAAAINFTLSAAGLISEMIIVSVNGDGQRSTDYMPNNTLSAYTNTVVQGDADKFSKYLTTELVPHTDQNFSTNKSRFIAGHSLGGLFVMDMFAANNGIFHGFFAYSPTFTHDKNSLDRLQARVSIQKPSESFLYMNIGYESEIYTEYFEEAETILMSSPLSKNHTYIVEYHWGVFHPFIMMTGQLSGLLEIQ